MRILFFAFTLEILTYFTKTLNLASRKLKILVSVVRFRPGHQNSMPTVLSRLCRFWLFPKPRDIGTICVCLPPHNASRFLLKFLPFRFFFALCSQKSERQVLRENRSSRTGHVPVADGLEISSGPAVVLKRPSIVSIERWIAAWQLYLGHRCLFFTSPAKPTLVILVGLIPVVINRVAPTAWEQLRGI